MDASDRANDHTGTPASTTVVGRFAPTPSGRMHLGNVFASLMAWAAARSAGGRMVLRIEDLDPRAQSATAAAALMDDLAWLGLDWDDGPIYQHNRTDRYQAAINVLAAFGLTYPCFCTRAELHAASAPHASDGTYVYQGTCRHLTAAEVARRSRVRTPATRVVVPAAGNPQGTVNFVDAVFGPQHEVLARDCGDFLVRRSDGVFAYQLAVVVDDGELGVTQVVRGRDLLGSAARQAWLATRLGHTPPTFAHIPLLVAANGRRLAKRDSDLDLGTLRERGADAEAIIGTLAHAVGLATRHERVSATQLAGRFSWEALRAHKGDIVVGNDFLPAF